MNRVAAIKYIMHYLHPHEPPSLKKKKKKKKKTSLTSFAGPCTICSVSDAVVNLLICTCCHHLFHRHCLQLPRFGYAGSIFICAGCLRLEAGIPSNSLTDRLARDLMSISAQSVQDSSQSTYHYGLQRFLKFTELARIPRQMPFQPHQEAQFPQTLCVSF
jgi:hypothetical protein